ncbi:phosphotransferase [Sphaerisporangium fuscum]|uniref:phosphotransferase n=1 Tax=Sphaerisporangium fuscum TaxID=2835868 RepID=UPI0027E39A38|nr:phosphotransferase [Sphaerisporangium fuscum]
MDEPVGRLVEAVVTLDGERLGTVGPFPVQSPHWAQVEPVVSRIEALLDVPVMVLRLLGVEGGEGGRDGRVTYHVEASTRPDPALLAAAVHGSGRSPESIPGSASTGLPDAALQGPAARRAAWATAGGLREAFAWAEAELRAAGRPPAGRVQQVKTWNLAGLFRLPTSTGVAWLKTTPPFAVCEAVVIEAFGRADPGLVPAVIAADPAHGRVLLEEIPGVDCWGASEEVIAVAVSRTATAQAALAGGAAVPGVPERTPRVLIGQVEELLDGETAGDLSHEELSRARRLAERLPELVTELEGCGLPNTLVHGDFHPGNWRSDGRDTVVLDFADAFHGNPVADGLRPRDFLPDHKWARARQVWVETWSRLVPGSDPARALEIAAPLVHLMYAVRYQEFLDGIERSERVYHEGDPATEVRAALDAWAVPAS